MYVCISLEPFLLSAIQSQRCSVLEQSCSSPELLYGFFGISSESARNIVLEVQYYQKNAGRVTNTICLQQYQHTVNHSFHHRNPVTRERIRGDEYLWEKAKLLNKKQWELIGRCYSAAYANSCGGTLQQEDHLEGIFMTEIQASRQKNKHLRCIVAFAVTYTRTFRTFPFGKYVFSIFRSCLLEIRWQITGYCFFVLFLTHITIFNVFMNCILLIFCTSCNQHIVKHISCSNSLL